MVFGQNLKNLISVKKDTIGKGMSMSVCSSPDVCDRSEGPEQLADKVMVTALQREILNVEDTLVKLDLCDLWKRITSPHPQTILRHLQTHTHTHTHTVHKI